VIAGAALPLLRLTALSVGPEVSMLRRSPGRVLAVFSGAVYLRSLEGYVVALVDAAAPDGPLSLRVRAFPPLRQAAARFSDALYRPTPDGFEIAGVAAITCEGATKWAPQTPRGRGGSGVTDAALALRSRLAEAGAGGCGPLAPYLFGAEPLPAALASDPFARRLYPALVALRGAIRACNSLAAAGAARALLGLGPGLTPSGDDALAGALAALVWLSADVGPLRPVLDAIATVAREEAPARTTLISARLLRYAADGVLYAPAMAVGAALLAGDAGALERAVRALFALGASTGRDVATGLLLGASAAGAA
jgi:hypothetical protein